MLLFPVFINAFILINYLMFINEDSIMFNLSKDNEADALKLIEKVYDVGPESG